LREILYKRYLVLAARVLYDVVNEQKEMDRHDAQAELCLELAQSARRLCAAPVKVTKRFIASCERLFSGDVDSIRSCTPSK